MVVPEYSATLEYPGETRVGLNGNHRTIAKYKSRRDPNFTAVSTELHRLVSEIVSEPVTSFAQAKYDQRLQTLIAEMLRHPKVFMMPYDRNPQFVGRDDILNLLRQKLEETNPKQSSHRLAIYGMGGVGKTQ